MVCIDLANAEHQTLREKILIIPQEAFSLQHAVPFNLDPAGQYADTQLLAALSKVGAGERWVTFVTSASLSQGQKQLCRLVGVVLGSEGRGDIGGVLLLDEATRNVDMETDVCCGV